MLIKSLTKFVNYHTALAVYTRSPAAYQALRGFGILQLPCANTLRTFTGFNLEKPGANERIAHAREKYDLMIAEKKKKGKKVPLSEGVLIFDEVKVEVKVHYHAKTGTYLGLSMSADELGSLHDVYQTLQQSHRTEQASYILQYLWRCLSSDSDVISPYILPWHYRFVCIMYNNYNYDEE